MSVELKITRAGPLVSVQDLGRMGHIKDGVSASGPMDMAAFIHAGNLLQTSATSGLEITAAGVDFTISGGACRVAFAGGEFTLEINGKPQAWSGKYDLKAGDNIAVKPGAAGNYGYVRFDAELNVPLVLDSRATNLIVGLGGLEGRALLAGDVLKLLPMPEHASAPAKVSLDEDNAPFRMIWGIHAERFSNEVRRAFLTSSFQISNKLDRMGVRLNDDGNVFRDARILSLVSDPIVPGDIQILGDGTPIVLMRDHQPSGGYPRVATLIAADMDRFAQMRPGANVQFESVTVETAQAARRK